MKAVTYCPEDYVRVNWFLTRLRNRLQLRKLTQQQFRTLRGQALRGDMEGAERTLEKLIREGSK